ncbi:MAG: RsmD family RNA methyltransferase [Clostridia bacterium]|nr:RsmD family RNA methyltransferase [Clostridia bacterium]
MASRVYLVDAGKRAFEIIKRNIQKTRLEGAVALCEDSLSFLKKQSGVEEYDIVFLDPPYASDLINDALSLLCDRDLIKETSYVVCESDRFDFLNEKNQANFEIIKTMKHGIAHISVLKKSGEKE